MIRAIFITGPQGTGKSTLARELKEIYSSHIIVEDPWDPMFLEIETIERAACLYVLVSNAMVYDLPSWVEVIRIESWTHWSKALARALEVLG